MWTHIIIGVVCFILGVVTVGAILFVKMARRNAVMERRIMEIAGGVANTVALQRTIYSKALKDPDVHDEFRRTRQMVAQDMHLETDSDLLEGKQLGS